MKNTVVCKDTSRIIHIWFGCIKVRVCTQELWDQRQNKGRVPGPQKLQAPVG